uniref:Uncharacterized protein n=1 Tax=Fagus sylvatica TaxID=28930 RepID=A0A2N9I0Q3_FAGSY
MAPVCGNRNKKGISDSKLQEQDELEIVQEEPQTSKDAKIEALRKERDVLFEALKNQQLRNRVEESDLDDGFENPFAKPNHRQQGGEKHHVQTTNLGSQRVKEASKLRFTIPGSQYTQNLRDPHLVFHEVGLSFEPHHGLIHGPHTSYLNHQQAHSIGQFGLGPGPGPNRERRSDLGFDCNPFPNTHHHDPFHYDREPRRLYGFDRQPHHLDREPYQPHGLHHRNNNNRNQEPLVLDRAPQDLNRTPRDLDRAPPGFDRTSLAFDHAPGFERAPLCVNLAQLGFDRAHPGYDLAPPPFDQEFPQTRVGHDCLAPPPFDQEHHQRDQMEGDYGGDWGFHHSHGLTHELLCASNVGQPWPNISFDPFRGFGTSPGPGLGLERSHNMGFDRAASSQDHNTHYSNYGPWGFDRAPRYQHQGNKSCDYSKYLNSSCSMPKAYGEGHDKTVFSYNEISVEQPPVYDIEVEDKNGDDEEDGITWKSMLP